MPPLLFIHIPKTAGTSFNLAAEKIFGDSAFERDYGQSSPDTTPLVSEHIYGKPQDPYAFHLAFLAQEKQWMTGHVFAEAYLHLFKAANTVAFVRDPVNRVISEYHHRQKHFDLDRSFVDFYRDPSETNKQFRMIGQCPWQAFHMVGLQERYDECLQLFEQTKGLNFPNITANVRSNDKTTEISPEVKQDIWRWNERDHIFYQQVAAYLDKQFLAASEKKPFCYHDLGFSAGEHVIGWAFYTGQETPVKVGLYVDGKFEKSVHASEHIADLQAIGAPRAGHVGFRFVLDDHKTARAIELKALDTEQTLFVWTAENTDGD